MLTKRPLTHKTSAACALLVTQLPSCVQVETMQLPQPFWRPLDGATHSLILMIKMTVSQSGSAQCLKVEINPMFESQNQLDIQELGTLQ